jgi:cholesterol oxidase
MVVNMRANYDAVVIGSGFGGAVAACRLAQAGLSVAVLERGRRYDVNQFPRNWQNIADGWLWSEGRGLFDVRPFQPMTIVQGAGLGGGSLIYANVHLRASAEIFERGWPQGYSRAQLDPYYDLVAYMLDIKPITDSHYLPRPTKTLLMEEVAASLKRQQQFCLPNIAVDFGEPEKWHNNKFGAQQQGCRYCGECDIGCNYHAKNTLDFNYLKLARDLSADLETECEVKRIEPLASGYKVFFTDYRVNEQLRDVQAQYLFVCAGAINSTELLLRCRDEYRTLSRLSPSLGKSYSGNGDFLAFAFNTSKPFKPSSGPTITSGIVYSRNDAGFDNWFIFEEGGYPKEIGALVQLFNPRRGLLREAEILSREVLHEIARKETAAKLGTPDPESDNTAIFLAMGRDLANGVIALHHDLLQRYELRIQWNTSSNLPLYDAERRLAEDVARAMGGNMATNPLWHYLHIPVSVHNLGGCLMADSPDEGVVDANGEVYGYPGLFVIDGAILPKATGVNPSHTIAAVAERNIEGFIRKLKPGWRAPEAAKVSSITDPLSSIKIPTEGVLPANAE